MIVLVRRLIQSQKKMTRTIMQLCYLGAVSPNSTRRRNRTMQRKTIASCVKSPFQDWTNIYQEYTMMMQTSIAFSLWMKVGAVSS